MHGNLCVMYNYKYIDTIKIILITEPKRWNSDKHCMHADNAKSEPKQTLIRSNLEFQNRITAFERSVVDYCEVGLGLPLVLQPYLAISSYSGFTFSWYHDLQGNPLHNVYFTSITQFYMGPEFQCFLKVK